MRDNKDSRAIGTIISGTSVLDTLGPEMFPLYRGLIVLAVWEFQLYEVASAVQIEPIILETPYYTSIYSPSPSLYP